MHQYVISVAASSMDAARRAIQDHEARHKCRLPDAAVVSVIPGGRLPTLAGAAEHNAVQPTYKHRVGAVRR